MEDKIARESDLSGSTQIESPICPARSQICPQYMLGAGFVHACHLALHDVYCVDCIYIYTVFKRTHGVSSRYTSLAIPNSYIKDDIFPILS